MFKYTLDNKRYHTLNYFYKKKFGIKVFKLSLNGGFTCPNLDGTKGYGGCIYCSKTGSGEFGGDKSKSLTEQVAMMKDVVNKKHIPCKYIGYFQARTNTYAPVDILKKKYEEVEIIVSSLRIDTVISRIIGTNRDKIKDKIKNKEIMINYNYLSNNSYTFRDGDIFSIRKFGKYKYVGIIKTTKKDNYIIKYLKYI